MVQNPIFTGAATALITPTTPEGVDYEALGKLIDWQIGQGMGELIGRQDLELSDLCLAQLFLRRVPARPAGTWCLVGQTRELEALHATVIGL